MKFYGQMKDQLGSSQREGREIGSDSVGEDLGTTRSRQPSQSARVSRGLAWISREIEFPYTDSRSIVSTDDSNE